MSLEVSKCFMHLYIFAVIEMKFKYLLRMQKSNSLLMSLRRGVSTREALRIPEFQGSDITIIIKRNARGD